MGAFLIMFGVAALPFAAMASPDKKKPLSLSAVTAVCPQSPVCAPLLLAQSRGYFGSQGLNVTLQPNSLTPPSNIALLISGNTQFLQAQPGGAIPAAQQGAPIRAVAETMEGASYQIAIASSVAAADGIPSASNTAADVNKQIAALKGTHLVIADLGTTTDSYNWVVYELRAHGLTVGVNAPNDDVNLNVINSLPLQLAEFNSGQVHAFADPLPYTYVPNVTIINLNKFPITAKADEQSLITTTSMIGQHPDTVQAMVTAVTEALQFMKTHRSQGEQIVGPQLAQFGYTDPSEQAVLYYQAFLPFASLAYPAKAAYNAEVTLIGVGQPGAITETWSQFTYAKFATEALKVLHLTFVNH